MQTEKWSEGPWHLMRTCINAGKWSKKWETSAHCLKRDKKKKISTEHNSLLLPPVYGHLATKETWPFDGSKGTSSALRLISGAWQWCLACWIWFTYRNELECPRGQLDSSCFMFLFCCCLWCMLVPLVGHFDVVLFTDNSSGCKRPPYRVYIIMYSDFA